MWDPNQLGIESTVDLSVRSFVRFLPPQTDKDKKVASGSSHLSAERKKVRLQKWHTYSGEVSFLGKE